MVGVLRVLWMVRPAAPDGVVVAARRVPGERALPRALGHRHVSASEGTRPGLNARRGNRAAAQVSPAHADVPPPVSPEGDEGATARISFRLAEYLKGRIEEAAAQAGLSVNAWLVRAAVAALEADDRGSRSGRRAPRAGQRYTGWVR